MAVGGKVDLDRETGSQACIQQSRPVGDQTVVLKVGLVSAAATYVHVALANGELDSREKLPEATDPYLGYSKGVGRLGRLDDSGHPASRRVLDRPER